MLLFRFKTFCLPIFSLCLSFPGGPAAFARAADVIQLLNGDRIAGEVGDFSGTRLSLRPGRSDRDTTIPAAYVHAVRLGRGEAAAEPAAGGVTVQWFHGDAVDAEIISFQEEERLLHLQVPEGPEVFARMAFISKLQFHGNETRQVHRVSLSPEDWPRHGNISRARLGPSPAQRTLEGLKVPAGHQLTQTVPAFPEHFVFELELRVIPGQSHYNLDLFVPTQGRGHPFAGLNLSAAPNRLTLMEITGRQPTRLHMDGYPAGTHEDEVHRWQFHADRNAETITAFFNGEKLVQWAIEDAFEGVLKEESQIRLRPFRDGFTLVDGYVQAWDGVFNPVLPEIPEGGVVVYPWLRSPYAAYFNTLGAGEVRLTDTEGNAVTEPMEALRQIRFYSPPYPMTRRHRRDVRVNRHDGKSGLTFQLRSWDHQEITGVSDAWENEVRIPRTWAGEIFFNIHALFPEENLRREIPVNRSHWTPSP